MFKKSIVKLLVNVNSLKLTLEEVNTGIIISLYFFFKFFFSLLLSHKNTILLSLLSSINLCIFSTEYFLVSFFTRTYFLSVSKNLSPNLKCIET